MTGKLTLIAVFGLLWLCPAFADDAAPTAPAASLATGACSDPTKNDCRTYSHLPPPFPNKGGFDAKGYRLPDLAAPSMTLDSGKL